MSKREPIMTKEEYMAMYARRDREDKAFARMTWIMVGGIAVAGSAMMFQLLTILAK